MKCHTSSSFATTDGFTNCAFRGSLFVRFDTMNADEADIQRHLF